MGREKPWGLIFLLFVLDQGAIADHIEIPDEKSVETLRLAPLISEALEKNAELKATEQAIVIKDAEIGPSGSYDDPVLGFEMMNYPIDSFANNRFGMTGNQVSMSQKIPFPGKLTKKQNAIRFESEAQKEELRQKRLEITKQVKLIYFELFAVYRKFDTLKEQRALLDQLIVVTRNNYALGKRSQAEVLNFQVESASLLDQELTQEKLIRSKFGEINHLLGRSDHQGYLYGRPESIQKTPIKFSDLLEKKLFEMAFSQGPMAKERLAMLKASEERLAYSNLNYLPDLEFKLGYTFRKPSPGDPGTDFASAMVGVSIPLWAGSKQTEENRGAAANKVRNEALLQEERNRIAHMIHVLFAELDEANKRVDLFEGGVLPLTRQAVAAGRSAYLTGKLDYATLLSSINKRFQMEVASTEALAIRESKIAEIEAMIGSSLGGAR